MEFVLIEGYRKYHNERRLYNALGSPGAPSTSRVRLNCVNWREPTSGLAPLTCSSRVVKRVLLHGFAKPAYLKGFLFPSFSVSQGTAFAVVSTVCGLRVAGSFANQIRN